VYSVTKTFIDGDIVVYRMAAGADSKGLSLDEAKANVDGMMEHILHETLDFPGPEGEEADDLISKAAAQEGPTSCVASIDKDMHQLHCWHYNFVKRQWKFVEEFDGLRFFYGQILTGDNADNIMGIDGIGPLRASQILEGCSTEKDLYERCVKAYDGDADRVVENGRLLWLRRKPDELWEPPDG
jgi:5'-3' exonuclease